MYCNIYKPKGATLYRGKYKAINSNVIINVALDTDRKDIAMERLKRIKEQADRKAFGMHCEISLLEEANEPVKESFERFIAAQKGKNNSPSHIKHVRSRLSRLIKECCWTRLVQITPASFEDWRDKVEGLSPKTLNEYLSHLMTFLDWLVKRDKLKVNPLKGRVDRVNSQGKKTFERRAYTHEEMGRLAESPDGRGAIYVAAMAMGLRRNEFDSLKWDSVKLDVPTPYIIVPADTSKNRKMACLEMPEDAVAAFKALRAMNPNSKPKDLVLPHKTPRMEVMRRDLKAAGIPLEDEMGRKSDFHSLRHTTATRMLASGVSVRIVQEFMRHSDIKLTTLIYTDASYWPMAEEFKKLSFVLPPAYLNSVQEGKCLSDSVKNKKAQESQKNASVSGKMKLFNVVSVPVKTGQSWRWGESNPRLEHGHR